MGSLSAQKSDWLHFGVGWGPRAQQVVQAEAWQGLGEDAGRIFFIVMMQSHFSGSCFRQPSIQKHVRKESGAISESTGRGFRRI